MRLNLFRGIPGSSKSTSARRMFPGVLIVENDMFHIHNGQYEWKAENMSKAISWCISMVRTALENGMDVCVANTLTKRKFVEAYKKIADEFGAEFHVYRCVGHFQNQHGLTPSMVAGFQKAMEDWPGETIVQPEQRMTYEVFNLSTDEVYGQFPSLREADVFIDGLADTELAAQVHIRQMQ